MEISVGDWVRTASGLVGQVLLVSKLSAFVEIPNPNGAQTITCLLSELQALKPRDGHSDDDRGDRDALR
jgi:hypothetical protein